MRILSAFAASAVMLTLAQPPTGIWPLAWAALVPFIVACCQTTIVSRRSSLVARDTSHEPRVTGHSAWTLCLAAYIVGLFYWLGNIYWMSYVTITGWIAFCAYTALLWPILALSIRFCRLKKIPLVLAVPVLVVGAEQTQGLFFGGFYWNYLAHSQYTNIALIQIADIFGAAGVSFLVAMVNGLISQLIITAKNLELRTQNSEKKPVRFLPYFLILNSKFSIIIAAAVVVGAIIYGRWRISQSQTTVAPGPMVAAVQSNVPQSVKESFAAEEQIFNDLLSESTQCISARPKIIAWPETMVQAILDPNILKLLDDSHTYRTFDKRLSEHAKDTAFLLVGAYGATPRIDKDLEVHLTEKFNSAFLYKPDGGRSQKQYGKVHLVPFGEYIPFRDTIPLLHKVLLMFTPYDYDYTLDAGREYTVFEMTDFNNPGDRIYRFSVMICYEDAVPKMARRFALDRSGRKQIDWLVNISNDGWFVRFKDDKVIPSTELAQHTAVCTFRAVENRVAILRSVNTGISCLIDTLGRIRDGFVAGNLPARAMARQGMAGWFTDRVPIDKRTTFFSRYGQWLDLSCEVCLLLAIIAQLLERYVPGKRITKESE